MTRSDAFIIVTCDSCNCAEEVQITATAHGWDERYVDNELESMGWHKNDAGDDLCSECYLEKVEEDEITD